MKKFILITFIFITILTIAFFGVKKHYQNDKTITIKKGETFTHYYKNNSCCMFYYNKTQLSKIKFKEYQKTYNPFDQPSLEGGTITTCMIFEGTQTGLDTLKFGIESMGMYLDTIENGDNNIKHYSDYRIINIID